jgi:nitrate/nitrite-specific signal transduction histidine kinase
LKRIETGQIELRVEDDGVGMDGAKAGEAGLGSLIIRQLANQFGGQPLYGARTGGGTAVSIVLTRIEGD